MNIRIVTDSASDIEQGFREDLTVVPMHVAFGDEEYLDGINLSHAAFYDKLVEVDDLPRTSQVPPYDFEQVFTTAVENDEIVIAIVMSAKLSGTYQSAVLAASEFGGSVYVVDSENVTIGERALVMRAFELVKKGLDAAEIVNILNIEKKKIQLVALLDTLEYLKRGGRISKSVALVGGILSIKPVIAIQHGEVVFLGKARGSKNSSNLLVQEIEKTGGIDFSRPFFLGYTGLSDILLQKYIKDSHALWEEHTEELAVKSVGGTIGTHIGPRAIAVAFFAN